MFQKDVNSGRTMLASPVSSPLPASSFRDTITATLIREEAAESLLPDIHRDAEFATLVQILNSYPAAWWLNHLSRVGADPAAYWSQQFKGEIKAATRGYNPPRRKKFLRWFTAGRTYELSDLALDPL